MAVSVVPRRENCHWSSCYSKQKCSNKYKSREVLNWKEDEDDDDPRTIKTTLADSTLLFFSLSI